MGNNALDDTNTDDTELDANTDDTDDTNDALDDTDTDNADDTDGDDADDNDDNDGTEFETTEDSADLDTTSATADSDSDSIDNTDSGSTDGTESGSIDDTESGNDSDGSTDDSESADVSVDADSEEEDVCEGLVESDCNDLADDDGDLECAYNKVSGDCYGIERRQGRFGSGNFDDGFIAAQQEADKDKSGLYAVIGVLGGVIGIMMIAIAFGAYYLYNKSNKGHAQIDEEAEMVITEDHNSHLMETQETR